MKLIAILSSALMMLGGVFGAKDFVSSYQEGTLIFLQADVIDMEEMIESTSDRRIAKLKEKNPVDYDMEMFSRAPLDYDWEEEYPEEAILEEEYPKEIQSSSNEVEVVFEEKEVEEKIEIVNDISMNIEEAIIEEILEAKIEPEPYLFDEVEIVEDRADSAVLDVVEPLILADFDIDMFSRAPLYDIDNISPLEVLVETKKDKKTKRKNKE